MATAVDTPVPEDLKNFRDRIDAIDERIHSLLNERARFCQQVGASKQAQGLHTADFYRPEREAQVLRRALERNVGPLRNEEIVRLFREIMSACLAQEEPLKVGFLGPEGTFSLAIDRRVEPAVRGNMVSGKLTLLRIEPLSKKSRSVSATITAQFSSASWVDAPRCGSAMTLA